MRTKVALSVKSISGKMFLLPSKRKNAKIPLDSNVYVEVKSLCRQFVVVRTNLHPNKFFLNAELFSLVFGITIEEHMHDIKQKAITMANIFKEAQEKETKTEDLIW